MKPSVFIFIIAVFGIKGVYLNERKEAIQKPADLLAEAESKVILTLSHKIPSYDIILWYQRSPGNTSLKLIASMYYTTPKVEEAFVGHFDVSGDGQSESSLHILKARQPEDSGEYFGAASNTVIKRVTPTYKNLRCEPPDSSSLTGNLKPNAFMIILPSVFPLIKSLFIVLFPLL